MACPPVLMRVRGRPPTAVGYRSLEPDLAGRHRQPTDNPPTNAAGQPKPTGNLA
jgi:hypothetical protein